MKVIASQSKDTLVVSMSVRELKMLSGFAFDDDFNKAFGVHLNYSEVSLNTAAGLIAIEDIPVATIYQEAKETLSAYNELRTKFESIRNQLTTLMKKMVQAVPQDAPKE